MLIDKGLASQVCWANARLVGYRQFDVDTSTDISE